MYTNTPRTDTPLLYSPPRTTNAAPIKLDWLPFHPSWETRREVAQDKDM